MLLSTGEQVSVALMAMAIQCAGRAGDQLHRRPDRHRHRQLPHQGPDPEHLDRPHGAGARRGQDRHRRRLPGRRRGLQHHHARPRRLATPRPWPWPPCWAPTPARSTPTSTASTRPTRGSCPRPRKIDRISYDEMLELASLGAGRDALPVDRVRQEVRRADPRPQLVLRRAGHLDRRRGGRPAAGRRGHRRGAGQGRGPDHDPRRARPAGRRSTRSSRRSPGRTSSST